MTVRAAWKGLLDGVAKDPTWRPCKPEDFHFAIPLGTGGGGSSIAPDSWLQAFMRRHNLESHYNLQPFRDNSGPEVKLVLAFLTYLHAVMPKFQVTNVINLDEMAWGLLHVPLYRVAPKGAPHRGFKEARTKANDKRTVMVAVNFASRFLMPMLIEERKSRPYVMQLQVASDWTVPRAYEQIHAVDLAHQNKRGRKRARDLSDDEDEVEIGEQEHAEDEGEDADDSEVDLEPLEPGPPQKRKGLKDQSANLLFLLDGGPEYATAAFEALSEMFDDAAARDELYFPSRDMAPDHSERRSTLINKLLIDIRKSVGAPTALAQAHQSKARSAAAGRGVGRGAGAGHGGRRGGGRGGGRASARRVSSDSDTSSDDDSEWEDVEEDGRPRVVRAVPSRGTGIMLKATRVSVVRELVATAAAEMRSYRLQCEAKKIDPRALAEMVLSASKRTGPDRVKDPPSTVMVANAKASFIRGNILITYIEALTESARNAKQETLLILDAAPAHMTQEVRSFCFDNRVSLLYVPPRATPELQPIDISIARPTRQYARRNFTQRVTSLPGKREKRILLTEMTAFRLESFLEALGNNRRRSIYAGFRRMLGDLPPLREKSKRVEKDVPQHGMSRRSK